MSYDLAVWHSGTSITDEDAEKQYKEFCDDIFPQITPEAKERVGGFVSEVTTRYPQIDGLPEDQVDDSPWSCAFDALWGYCVMSMVYSAAEEVAPFVVAMAAKHGLVCYDPQGGNVYLPPHLMGEGNAPGD